MTTQIPRAILWTTLALLTACEGADARSRQAGRTPADAPAEAEAGAEAGAVAPSSYGPVVTAGGARVSLDLLPGEIRAGSVTVTIAVDGGASAAYPRSVDVMSPTMPMHGVVRVPVQRDADGAFTATVPIAMSGRWALFVNLDEDGTDTAEFQFDALPALPAADAAGDRTGGQVH